MTEEEPSAEVQALKLLDTVIATLQGHPRPGQQQMLRGVVQSLESGEHLIVQAGTGTGKTLAYLLPLLLRAHATGRPMLVATATVALQAQIMERDIPLLQSVLEQALDRPLAVVLLKGRGNYVCKQKLAALAGTRPESPLFTWEGETEETPGTHDQDEPTRRLLEWAEKTATGDRDELLPGVEDRIWRKASLSALECPGSQRCPFGTECFSELARIQATTADLIVTNHAMLALDLFRDTTFALSYEAVAVDEAHEFVDRVTDAVTGRLSPGMIDAFADMARSYAEASVDALRRSARAFQTSLRNRVAGWAVNGLDKEQVEAILQVVEAIREAGRGKRRSGEGEAQEGSELFYTRGVFLMEQCERLLSAIPLDQQKPPRGHEEVIWLTYERSNGKNETEDDAGAIHVAPLQLASRLRSKLFAEHTTILTSATLSVGGSFVPLQRDVGLWGADAPANVGIDVGSPFHYSQQGMLYIAAHLAKPSAGLTEEQLEELEALIRASGGGALCLFSSRRAVGEAAEVLREKLDVVILEQGESSLSALIRRFRQEENSCLLGTLSLWQGVDVPGPSCRLVTIDKLPFPHPDDPLTSARSRAVALSGGNGFLAVYGTQAAIRLAQGTGRLIRASDDRGVVAVLDSRLATARYGPYLCSALPHMWRTQDRQVVLGALARLRTKQASDV